MDRAAPLLPGRLGTPDLDLAGDPRADPRMIAAMAPLGMAARAPASSITGSSPLDDIHELCAQAEVGFEAAVVALTAGLPPRPGIEHTLTTIEAVDGHPITLHVHRPADRIGPSPAVLHLHGGAMVFFEAQGIGYQRWRDALATQGLVAIGVEFRNGSGRRGPHPFPAGLDDCTSALAWVSDHRRELGMSTLVVSGESGGGNLSLATALCALRRRRSGQSAGRIDGVYAQCPYISNAYASGDPKLPSLVENDGYMLACDQMSAFATAYDPSGAHATDPLAWPLHATPDDLRGLPPHVISVNQLDPLRDEGLAYFRALLGAGVPAVSRTVNGTCHAGDCLFEAAMPDVYWSTIRDIVAFARSLEPHDRIQ